MGERDPRLKQCPKCDNWVGASNLVGSCADCMNSKGFDVSCDCGVPGCAACWDGTPDDDEKESLPYSYQSAMEDAEFEKEEVKVISSGIRHCTQCNVQIARLAIDDHCSACLIESR